MTNTIEEQTNTVRPYYKTEENADAYEVKVYMPGVGKDGIGISLEKDDLLITGHKNTGVPEGWRVLSRESNSADYQLRLTLNVEVDGENIQARTENGILLLTLPKAEAEKPKRIDIQ